MTSPDPEDRRKHLDFIQAVVTRMSAASTSAKSWLLPVVTATYGYGMTQNAWSVIVLGLGAVVLFMFLDAHYLDQEKAYRALYDAVVRNRDVPVFSLDPRDGDRRAFGQGSPRRVTPQEAEEETDGGTPGSKEKKTLSEVLAAWWPHTAVWQSWSIAPFYGSLILVGLVLWVRVACF